MRFSLIALALATLVPQFAFAEGLNYQNPETAPLKFIHFVKSGDVAIRACLYGKGITDDDLVQLAEHEHLKVIQCVATSIRGSGIKHLEKLKELEILSFYGTTLDDSCAKHISQLKSLLTFSVSNMLFKRYSDPKRTKIDQKLFENDIGLTDHGLDLVLTNPELRAISLPGHMLSSEGVFRLLNSPNLQAISLQGHQFSPAVDYSTLNPAVKRLLVPRSKLSIQFLDSLKLFKNLEAIDLSYTNFKADDIEQVVKAPRLRYIVLYGVKDSAIIRKKIESINPFLHVIVDSDFEGNIGHASGNLDLLTLASYSVLQATERHLNGTESSSIFLLDEDTDRIRGYMSVGQEDTQFNQEIHSDIPALLFLPNLEFIIIARQPLINSDLEILVRLKNKLGFEFADTGISDAFVIMLCIKGESRNTLEHLQLEHNRITDRCLRSIASLPKLNRLLLGYNEITDKGIEHLTRLERLEDLSLEGCVLLSDESIHSIAKIKSLKLLIIKGTSISKEAQSRLSELRPDLKIVDSFASPDK